MLPVYEMGALKTFQILRHSASEEATSLISLACFGTSPVMCRAMLKGTPKLLSYRGLGESDADGQAEQSNPAQSTRRRSDCQDQPPESKSCD